MSEALHVGRPFVLNLKSLSKDTSVSVLGDGNSVGLVAVPGSPFFSVVTSTKSFLSGLYFFFFSSVGLTLTLAVVVFVLAPVAMPMPATETATAVTTAKIQTRCFRMLGTYLLLEPHLAAPRTGWERRECPGSSFLGN